MNDAQLEHALRATLNARADTVTRGPDWQAPADLAARRGRARHVARWFAPLAAAAAVAAVVASVVAIEHESSGRHVPPTKQQPTNTSTKGITTTSTPRVAPTPNALQPMRCTRPLPESWQQAITAATVSTPGRQVTPVAVDDSGDALADEASKRTTRYINFTVPYSHDLVLVTPDGKTRPLYSGAPPAVWRGRRIGTVSTEGDWVAFALVVGAASGSDSPEQIELVNIATGATRTLRPTVPNDATIVFGPVIERGAVYWTEIQAGRGLDYGPLYRYDIATRQRTVMDPRATSGPYVAAGTVSWTDDTGVIRSSPGRPLLPAGFHLDVALSKGSPLLTDGRTYVWQDRIPPLAIRAARPGTGGTITAVPRGEGGQLAGLTGDFVWWDGNGGAWVADLRTGAASQVTHVGSSSEHGYPVLAAAHAVVFRLGADRLAVLDTARLPALHC